MKKFRVYIIAISLLFLLCQSENVISALSFDTKIAYAEPPRWGWRMENGTEVSFIINTALRQRTLSPKEFTKIYTIELPVVDGDITERWCGSQDYSMCDLRYVGAWLPDGTKLNNIIPELMEY